MRTALGKARHFIGRKGCHTVFSLRGQNATLQTHKQAFDLRKDPAASRGRIGETLMKELDSH